MTKFLTRVFRFIGSSIKPNRGERGVERVGADVRIPIAVVFLSWDVGGLNCKEEGRRWSYMCTNKKGYSRILMCSGSPKRIPLIKSPSYRDWVMDKGARSGT